MEVIPNAKQDHGVFASRGVTNVFDKPSAIFAAIVLGFRRHRGCDGHAPCSSVQWLNHLVSASSNWGWLASSDMGGVVCWLDTRGAAGHEN